MAATPFGLASPFAKASEDKNKPTLHGHKKTPGVCVAGGLTVWEYALTLNSNTTSIKVAGWNILSADCDFLVRKAAGKMSTLDHHVSFGSYQ
jgi:hypothetical protein